MKDDYKLKTLSRALDVMELIGASTTPMSLTEIAKKTNEVLPIIYRILNTLEKRGYLYRRTSDKRYSITSRTIGAASVHRAFSILRAMANFAPNAFTEKELCESTGIIEKEIYELLDILAKENVVENFPSTGRWNLSYSLIEIIGRFINCDEIINVVRPLMERLRLEIKETLVLFKRSGARQVAAAVVPSPNAVRYEITVGTSFPIHLGAAGKALLATFSDEELDSFFDKNDLKQLTNYKTNAQTLKVELKEIQKNGYAVSTGERIEGSSSVAVPIFDSKFNNRGTLALMIPTYRTTPQKIRKIGLKLKREVGNLYLPPQE